MNIPHISDYNLAIQILRNNHWFQRNRAVWENSNGWFISEASLFSNPKGAVTGLGYDWNYELQRLNSSYTPPAKTSNPLPYKSINWDAWNDEITSADINPNADIARSSKPICVHSWVTYKGLQEVFDYCKKCSVKK